MGLHHPGKQESGMESASKRKKCTIKHKRTTSPTSRNTRKLLNSPFWTEQPGQNQKAFKSGRDDSSKCENCDQDKMVEHLFLDCDKYANKIWENLKSIVQEFKSNPGVVNLTQEHIYNERNPTLISFREWTTFTDHKFTHLEVMRGKFMRILREMLTSENVWSKLRSLEKQTYKTSVFVKTHWSKW